MKHLAAATIVVGAMSCAAPPPADTVIRNVNIVDVSTGRILEGMAISVLDERILAVGATDRTVVPERAVVIDGSEAYVIPGLWDMHVHALNPNWNQIPLRLFVANGVTGFRDTWGSLAIAGEMEELAARGQLPLPRYVLAGNLVDGENPIWPTSLEATTPERGRAIVDSLVDAGAGFIKVYSKLSPETYDAIAEQATARGIPFAGHVPRMVTPGHASDLGQRTIEHLTGVIEACSSESDEIQAALIASITAESAEPFGTARTRTMDLALNTQDDASCTNLLTAFIDNETWQVPTLVTLRGVRNMDNPAFQRDLRLEYMPVAMRSFWNPDNATYSSFASDVQRRAMMREREIVGMMDEAGVPLLAGSDTPNPYAFPGFGLHDELSLLVESGLSPLRALQAATISPARFLGALDTLGTVDRGKLADFVLLDGNPLDDIENVRSIRGVMLRGEYLDRDMLNDLLNEVRREVR